MISKTIGFRGTRHFQTHPYESNVGKTINHPWLGMFLFHRFMMIWGIVYDCLTHIIYSIPKGTYLQHIKSLRNDETKMNTSDWPLVTGFALGCIQSNESHDLFKYHSVIKQVNEQSTENGGIGKHIIHIDFFFRKPSLIPGGYIFTIMNYDPIISY